MGLDGVELVMEFEEEFGIEIKDEEAVEIKTPRMVVDLICSKLKNIDEHTCQTQRTFYILRNAFVKMFGLERKSITPDISFRNFIEKSKEKEIWEQIRKAIAARDWPKLVRPLLMSRVLSAIGFAIFGVTICAVIYYQVRVGLADVEGIFFAACLGILLVIPYAIIAARLTRPWKIYIPLEFKSIRDLIPYAVTSNQIKWDREVVSIRVKQIVMEQLGLEESYYTEDSRFIEDFNID
ncbi:MAG: acyl carrier protein [Planctomycetota bacterium]|jgi:acyl carrier protein